MARTWLPVLVGALLAACSGTVSRSSIGGTSQMPADGGPDGGELDGIGPDGGQADGGENVQWQLIWSDEFDGPNGSSIDASKWSFDLGGGGWGNGELEYYTDLAQNVVQDGGTLVITALQQPYMGSQYTSGRIKSEEKFSFTYGRVEMRAQLPEGQGVWPAFWLLGANIDQGVAWPDCGEIDIMEFVEKTPVLVYGTIHGPGYSGAGGLGAWHQVADLSNSFHIFAVEWVPGEVRWYVDDQLYEWRTVDDLTGRTWVFDHNFFIILNLAIGGAFPGPPDGTTSFPQQYVIDYVRVYQPAGNSYPPLAPRKLVTIHSRLNNSYVTADNSNADLLAANRATASTWEMFEERDLPGGTMAFLALADDKWVGVRDDGVLDATSESIGPSETFTLRANADGSTSLIVAGTTTTVIATTAGGALGTAEGATDVNSEFDLAPP